MGTIRDQFSSAFRDYALDGVPASGAHDVVKADVRALGTTIENVLSAIGAGIRRFSTVAAMDADLTGPDGALAYVYYNNGSTTDPLNGVYQYKAATTDWILADWYFDAVAAVVQPLLDDTEAARDEAEALVDQLHVAETEEQRRKWHAMLTELNAGNVQRGLVDLTEYGIDPLPATWDVLLFWTGSVLYPLRKVVDGFNNGWRDGDITYVSPAGETYYSVSIAKLFDPTLDASLTVTSYYAGWELPGAADNTNPGQGASLGAPWKSLNYALTQAKAAAVPFVIHYYGDRVGPNNLYSSTAMTLDDNLKGKIHFHPTSRSLTWIFPQRETLTKASFAWVSVGNGTWRCSQPAATIPDTVKKTFASVDALCTDDDDIPTPYKYFGTGASQAAVETAVKALPGSHGWYGTTGVDLHLYCHTLDGREPDPVDWWHSEGTQNSNWNIGEGALLFMENVGSFHWDQGTYIAGIRARPISVPTITPRVIHTGQFFMYNFAVLGCSGPAIQMYDIAKFAWDRGYIKHCGQDAENIHSYYATTAGAGDYMFGWSNRVKAEYIGYSRFGNPPAAGTSNQVSSVHDSANFVRTNQIGGFTTGACMADVLGALTWTLNCHYYDPTHGAGLGPPGAGSPRVAFWADGAIGGAGARVTKAWVWNSSGKVPAAANEFSATNNGVIAHAKHIGKVTAETYAGGTVTNLG